LCASEAAIGNWQLRVMRVHMKHPPLVLHVALSTVWLAAIFGSVALLNARIARPATYRPDEIEIQASLIGYNLLWPSRRCCAYDLHIYPDGHETIAANVTTGDSPRKFSQELKLTSGQVEKIRQALKETDYLNVPDNLCCGGVDSDERKLSVRIGAVTHSVIIPEDLAADAPPALRQQFERLMSLWAVVTEQAHIPGATLK
jgi:hypothetical protein